MFCEGFGRLPVDGVLGKVLELLQCAVVGVEEGASRRGVSEETREAGRSAWLEELGAPLHGGEHSECSPHVGGFVRAQGVGGELDVVDVDEVKAMADGGLGKSGEMHARDWLARIRNMAARRGRLSPSNYSPNSSNIPRRRQLAHLLPPASILTVSRRRLHELLPPISQHPASRRKAEVRTATSRSATQPDLHDTNPTDKDPIDSTTPSH